MTTHAGSADDVAAVFVYKDDGTQDDAVAAATRALEAARKEWHVHNPTVVTAPPSLLVASFTDREDLLDTVNSWCQNGQRDCFCLYAHMGEDGVGCVSEPDCRDVSWAELEEALAPGAAHVWLLGCTSGACVATWDADVLNCIGTLLITTCDDYYAQGLTAAVEVIRMYNWPLDDQLVKRLDCKYPDLVGRTERYVPKSHKFRLPSWPNGPGGTQAVS
jgi:hypothetical protein